jgi:hypothetical protein
MSTVPFPDDIAVDFRVIAGWPEHAVSDDGRVWVQDGEEWQLMETATLRTGPESVWLQNAGGRQPFAVRELFERTFDPVVAV